MSVGIRVKLDYNGFADYVAKLGEKFKPAVVRGLQSAAMRAIPIVQQATVEARPASPNGSVGAVDTNSFNAAWRSEATADGARIFNVSTHGPVVEHGRRAGRKPPPREVIERWARRKLGLSEEEAKRAAFPIAREIGRRGLRGRKILASAKPAIIAAATEEVRDSCAQMLVEVRQAARSGRRGP